MSTSQVGQVAREVDKNFDKLDQNRDSQIDKKEFEGLSLPRLSTEQRAEVFARISGSASEQATGISRQDLNIAAESPANHSRRDAMADKLAKDFHGYDTDQDGALSLTETRGTYDEAKAREPGFKERSFGDFQSMKHQVNDSNLGITQEDLSRRRGEAVSAEYFGSEQSRTELQTHVATALERRFSSFASDGGIGQAGLNRANLTTPDGRPIPSDVLQDIRKTLTSQVDDGRISITADDLRAFLPEE